MRQPHSWTPPRSSSTRRRSTVAPRPGIVRNGEVPRAAAHAWAARGHVLGAQAALDEQAREHARQSVP
jgi:hypothetical protein